MNQLAEDSIYGYSMYDERSSPLYTVCKRTLFHLSKWTGLFHVARRRTAQGLRIICYHGFSLEDEDRFRPRLFMRASTFRRRLEYIKRMAFPVLSLDEALDRLEEGALPAGATVITIDDGFYSVYQYALPLLREFSFPATLYIATSNFLRGQPIFRLVVQYMFWRTREESLDAHDLTSNSQRQISLTSTEDRHRVMWEIVQYGDALDSDEERSALASKLGLRLGLNYRVILKKRLFCLMNRQELSQVTASGIQVQLHTHSHRFPQDPRLAEQEIRDNRNTLTAFATGPLRHLCYPSGIWSDKHWPLLEAAGIRSAVTCDPGFNYPHTPRLAMKRFLDGEHIPQVEFEAELSGYAELLRTLRGLGASI